MLLEAESMLTEHGYEVVPPSMLGKRQSEQTRILEDEYGVVLLQSFDSIEALLELWQEAQASLVKILVDHVVPGAAKGWEGYLILMTPAHALERDLSALMEVRYDTTRTRKIIIGGADRLRRGMDAVLPLPDLAEEIRTNDPIEFVPRWLETAGIPPSKSQALLEAYRNQGSLLEALEDPLASESSKNTEER
jgi:hypothetical protein